VRYAVGPCLIDVDRRQLLRAGEAVHVEPQVFDLIHFLVKNRHRVVDRYEIARHLSRGGAVSDELISTRVKSGRKALGDNGSMQRTIRTVHGKGFQFVGSVKEIEEEASDAGAPAERRLITVLYCGLAGATELAARLDPEDFRDRLLNFLRRATGILEQESAVIAHEGDSIFAHFSLPMAGEHDAERAVRTGLTLVAEFARSGGLEVRVGIATGVVVVDHSVRSPTATNPTIVGETPGLAAALKDIAEPGVLLIDTGTRRLVGRLFVYRDLAAQTLRGFPEPVAAWRVLGPGAVASRFQALRSRPPLVARTQELELLVSSWNRAATGSGQIVLLCGDPGIGKSRLVTEIGERLKGLVHTDICLSCSPHHRNSELYPFIIHVRHAAGLEHAVTPQECIAKLALFLSLPEDNTTDLRLFVDLLSIPDTPRSAQQLDGQQKRSGTLEAMFRHVERTAAERPVLIVLEDLQWIDATSIEFVRGLIRRVPKLPVLFIITSRPGAHLAQIGTSGVETIALAPLDTRDASRLIGEIASGHALPTDILLEIVSRSDGIPLFLEELTLAALEAGSDRPRRSRQNSTGPSTVGVPQSLQASLLARLDKVGAAKATAQLCAALGRTFPFDLPAIASPEPDDALRTSLSRLVAEGLLLLPKIKGQEFVTFRHALVQDAAYGSLLRAQRQEVHLRIAQALEAEWPEYAETRPELLAHHFTEAGATEPAIAFWLKAGRRAVARSANIEAIDCLRHALGLLRDGPSSPERMRLEFEGLIALGPALMATRGYGAAECLETFQRAGELLGTSNSATEHMMVRWGTWNVHYGRAELDLALQAAEQCIATADQYRLGEALARRLMGQTLCTMGNFTDARRHLESGITLCLSGNHEDMRASADNHVTCLTYLSLTLWPMGRLEEAAEAATSGLVRARKLGHVVTTAIALHTGVVLGTYGGDPALAAQYASEALAFAMEHRLANYEYWARFNQGVLVAQSGDAHRGIEIMRSASKAAPERVRQQFRPRNLAHMAAAHCALGDIDAALSLIDEAFQIVEATNERQFEAELHRIRGETFLKAQQSTEGEMELHAALAVARRQSAQLWALRAATSLAEHWLEEGRDADEARRLLNPIQQKILGGSHLPDLMRADALLGNHRTTQKSP